MATDTATKIVTSPGTNFALAKERLEARLADAVAERADAESRLYQAQSESLEKGDAADREASNLSKLMVELDAKVRSLKGALPALDRQQAEAVAKAEEARLAGVQQKLERAVVALDKATAKVADDLLMFTASLDAAKRAEEKCSGLAGQLHQALHSPGVLQRVHFAMFKAGYNPPELTSLDLPSQWNKLDAIAAMKEPRRLRKTVPSPASLPSGIRKVAAEVLVPPAE
jgi:hypothetical protein